MIMGFTKQEVNLISIGSEYCRTKALLEGSESHGAKKIYEDKLDSLLNKYIKAGGEKIEQEFIATLEEDYIEAQGDNYIGSPRFTEQMTQRVVDFLEA